MGAIKDKEPRYGTYRCPEFGIEGDFLAAYQWLKQRFDPAPHSNSGPVKPLSAQERLADQNPGIVDTLQELPPTSIYD